MFKLVIKITDNRGDRILWVIGMLLYGEIRGWKVTAGSVEETGVW